MYSNTGSRMRSGSGTSRTTATSDSGEFFDPAPHHSRSHPTLNASLSPSRILANLPPMAYSPAQPSGSSTSSFPALSPGGVSSIAPSIASNPASVLSPIATRMRERDADAMEKYKLRQRSGSATTASTADSPLQNGTVFNSSMPPPDEDDDLAALHSLVTVGSVAPRRRLRPSASATQLRSNSHNELASPATPNSQDPSRNRSGTSPAMLKQQSSPARHTPSHSETLPLTPTQNSVRPHAIRGGPAWETDPQRDMYMGPPSEYARFPPPPVPPKEPPEKQTTPTTTTPTSHTRRLPFNILSSHKHSDHNANPNHKRNISMSSIGAKV